MPKVRSSINLRSGSNQNGDRENMTIVQTNEDVVRLLKKEYPQLYQYFCPTLEQLEHFRASLSPAYKKKSPVTGTLPQSPKPIVDEKVDKAKQIEKTQNCLGFTD